MPRTPTALLAALLLAAPAAALPRRAVPQIDSPEEQEDPDFHKLPAGQDLRSLVSHVRDTISGPAGTGSGSGSIPSVDLFISNLEGQLRRGNDLPRDKILRNADAGRDSLRAAYNQLTQVEALLPGVRDAFAGANEKLLPALQRNAESLRRLKEVAETARAMVEQIVVERPASPGKPPSTAELNAIASQEAELRALTALLRQAEQDLKKAKGLLAGLKGSSAQIQELADKAAVLDQDALGHVGQRRTRGAAVTYRTDMNSREVLANANRWLQSATNRAEAIVRLMEQDATLKAVERATEADVATMNARDRDISLAERLVFNHDVRLNDLIQYGYDVASDERRQWWVGRAGAAKASCAEDSGKMS
ncbi:MAG TPA: hypothetical protein VNI01_08140, partial [Elusimicrobiota bacterium]|nr:hypothetical protein [Elusimicrobiota bacterium]